MARTKRSPLNMHKPASLNLIRETLLDINEEIEDLDAVNKKICELLRKNKLKKSKYKNSRHQNVKRLLSFYANHPDQMPSLLELQPYETINRHSNRMPLMLSHTLQPSEVIDLTD